MTVANDAVKCGQNCNGAVYKEDEASYYRASFGRTIKLSRQAKFLRVILDLKLGWEYRINILYVSL